MALGFDRALESLVGSDILFFDPDNGIEVPSKPLGHKDSSKYVYWHELEQAWNSNTALLVYQHFPHKKRTEFIPAIVNALEGKLKGARVIPFKTTLAFRSVDESRVAHAQELINNRWSRRISSALPLLSHSNQN